MDHDEFFWEEDFMFFLVIAFIAFITILAAVFILHAPDVDDSKPTNTFVLECGYGDTKEITCKTLD